MATPTIYIASKPVGNKNHLYLYYDPDTDEDNDPTTGSGMEIIRGGPENEIGSLDYVLYGYGDTVVEVGVDAATSEDKFDGDTPEDRNFTVLEQGAGATQTWNDMKDTAEDMGTYDPENKETAVDWGYGPLGPNSNATIHTVLRDNDYDIYDVLPVDSSTQEQMDITDFPGGTAIFGTVGDDLYDLTTVPTGQGPAAIYDAGGEDIYVLNPDNTTWVVEDNDPNTDDQIIIEGINVADASYVRRGDDLIIFGDPGGGRPIAIIKDHFGPNGPKIDSIGFDDGTVPTAGLNPTQFTPAPLPGWTPDILTPFDGAKTTYSPLIIDLDLDGVEATAFNGATTATFFDLYSNDFAVQTAWAGSDDGLLVRDLDDSGTIENSTELFGSATIDGFALLSQLDSNGDLFIDADDDEWSDLLIRKDANGDAVTQSGELQSLSYYNITSISLAGVAPSTSTINGNPVSHTSTVTMNGSAAAIADVWFVHDHMNTLYQGDTTFDPRVLFLPTLRGFGRVADLHVAMSGDEDLLGLVEDLATGFSFATFADAAALNADIEAILLEWAGVDNVATDSRGPFINAQHLEFLERLIGEEWRQFSSPNPGPNAAAELEEAWSAALHHMTVHLLVQVGAQALFGESASYNIWSGEIEGDLDLDQQAIDDLVPYATDTGVDAEAYWLAIADFIHGVKGLGNLTAQEEGWLDDAVYDSDPNLSWADIEFTYFDDGSQTGGSFGGTSGDDTLYGTSYDDSVNGYDGNDALYGQSGDDYINGGLGNDILDGDAGDDELIGHDGDDEVYGGYGNDELFGGNNNDILSPGEGGNFAYGGHGNDTYLYGGGGDVYRDDGGTDKIVFGAGITSNDLTFERVDATDLLITIDGYGTIQIEDHVNFSAGDTRSIDTIEFNDTSTLDLLAVTGLVTYGTSGNDSLAGVWTLTANYADVIYGYEGDDYINAGDGDDIIYGGAGNDDLWGNTGNDVLDGGSGNDSLKGHAGDDLFIASPGYDEIIAGGDTDTLLMPEAYGPADLSFFRLSSDKDDLRVVISGLGQIEVRYQFVGSNDGIEYIEFEDESPTIDLSATVITTYGTDSAESISGMPVGISASENDIIYAYGGNDNLNPATGNDIVYAGSGNDTVNGHNGNDVLYGEDGDDNLRGNAGDDTIYGGAGNDIIYGENTSGGSTGNNIMYGEDGDDYLYGNSGNDYLDGGAGNDYMKGAAGSDIYVYTGGLDIVEEGLSGADVLRIFDGSTINDLSFAVDGTTHTIVIAPGTDEIDMKWYGSGVQFRIETLEFSDGFITTQLNDYTNWDWGTASGESINGTASADTMIGKAGADTIDGAAGNDAIHGGAGDDTLEGGDGDDLLHGGTDDDVLYGEDGLDTLFGGAGVDTFVLEAASAFNDVDTIEDFSTVDGDAIDIADLLVGYNPTTSAIADFVSFVNSGDDSQMFVDRDGTSGTYSSAQVALVKGIIDLDAEDLLTGGNLLAA